MKRIKGTKYRSQVYDLGEVKVRITVTRWLRLLAFIEVWTPISPHEYVHSVHKTGR